MIPILRVFSTANGLATVHTASYGTRRINRHPRCRTTTLGATPFTHLTVSPSADRRCTPPTGAECAISSCLFWSYILLQTLPPIVSKSLVGFSHTVSIFTPSDSVPHIVRGIDEIGRASCRERGYMWRETG